MSERERKRYPRIEAEQVAEEICKLFGLCADLVKPAGSLRRGTATVKDVEIIMLGRRELRPEGLFGDPKPTLSEWEFVNDLVGTGTLAKRIEDGKPHFGERSQRVVYKGYPVDLFVTYEPGRYGVLELIRTGPYPFSKLAVTQVNKCGLLFAKYNVKEQAIWLTSSGEEQFVPTEGEYFTYLDCPFMEPNMRGDYADAHNARFARFRSRGRR